MAYRPFANWQIDLQEPTKDRGTLGWREILGVGEYILPIGIKFKQNEIRILVRSSNLMTLAEVQRAIPERF